MTAEGGDLMRKKIETNPFWILLALIFLLEAWLWDHLAPLVAAVVNVIPWTKLKTRLQPIFDRAPPWVALFVFLIPLILAIPVKFLEFWFIAHGWWISALITLVMAKVVGLGIIAFVFDITRHKLLQIGWFKRVYDYVMWLRDWAHGLVDPLRHRIEVWLRLLKPGRGGRLWKRLVSMRRKLRA
jgi:hypothetical protein